MSEGAKPRVQDLFDQVVNLPPGERPAFLDAACGGDAALRVEVESLLAHDQDSAAEEDFLQSPLVRVPPAWAEPLPSIGHYRILRLLGEGGMGTVYEAEQESPRRTVALKVIRPGLLSPALVKRFRQEAQILSRLQHPGIAQVYEAGLTDAGQPFFAMEFIRGVPLDEHVRGGRLDRAALLTLFARVCDAVQHAHDRGVIHRDLKPANILVDEAGQPHVLDFGVARATDADLQTTSGRTEAGQLLGTLSYMSPEQIAADPAALDRRSDVYTLGVILYELLAQRLPYRLDHLPLPQAAQVIHDEEPTRLGSVNTLLRGDVEIIVARALEKDRARRYASAADLAADVRRYLSHEPILARRPSALYQLGKFTRRHKGLVGAVVGIMAALVLGLVGTLLFAVRAENNARVANAEKRLARFETYRARIAAAAAALTAHDVADAARHLDNAPEELRGWEWRHLHSRLDDSSAIFTLPTDAHPGFLYSPDGLRVVTSTATSLRLTDEDGRECRTLPLGGVWPLHSVAAGGSLWVVHREDDHHLRVLDEAGKTRWSGAAPPTDFLVSAALSPDRAWLAVSWAEDRAFFLELDQMATGTRRRVTTEHRLRIANLNFSPDGSRVLAASDDNTASVWDVRTGTRLTLLQGHTAKVHSAAFRPDGARLATASADGTVRQWDPVTGREVAPPFERHTGEVMRAAYSPDGEWLASAGTDRTVRVWRAESRQEVAVLHGHTGDVNDLTFSDAGRRLVSLGEDSTVRVWEVGARASLPELRGHTSYVYPVACSPEGRWIASGSWDHTARLWDAATGEAGPVLPHGGVVRDLAIAPDGSWLVTGGDEDGRLRIWNCGSGQPLKEVEVGEEAIWSLALSPDGRCVATGDKDGAVKVTEWATGRTRSLLEPQGRDARRAVAYSPDGRWLAAGSVEGVIQLWDARTYQVVGRLSGHSGDISSLAFSPDSHRLVSASLDRTVRLWQMDTLRCGAVLQGHTDVVFTAVFHPDGSRIASAGRDRAVWLWDVASGEEVARLPGHTNYVWSLAFSPDGTTLVSGSGDGTVRLWDTAPLAQRDRARRRAVTLYLLKRVR